MTSVPIITGSADKTNHHCLLIDEGVNELLIRKINDTGIIGSLEHLGGFFIMSLSTASTPNDCATGPSQIISMVVNYESLI